MAISNTGVRSGLRDLLQHLFREWNKGQVRYLVLRNYEGLPDFTGNDIDVLVHAHDRCHAEQLLRSAGEEQGWIISNVVEFACLAVTLFHRTTLEQVHIDLMYDIQWHELPFLSSEEILSRRRPIGDFYAPAAAHEAAVNLMTRLVYGGYVKENYRAGISAAATHYGDELFEALSPWIGRRRALLLVAHSKQGCWDQIESQAYLLRASIILTNLRRPLRFARRLGLSFSRIARRWLQPPGVAVVFIGPDGSGKTNAASQLAIKMSRTFYPENGLHCHWKPGPRKDDSTLPTTTPHGKPPRNSLSSVAFFSYHYLAFVIGWWVYVKPVLFRNGLVTIDRYYYDFFVDLARYRLNVAQWIVRLAFSLVKEPDLVFYLDAPAETLQDRKQETSFEETVRQRNAYRALVSDIANAHLIDASLPLETTVADVERIVLTFLARRTELRKYFG